MPKKIFSNRIVMTQARVGKLPTPPSGQIIYYRRQNARVVLPQTQLEVGGGMK